MLPNRTLPEPPFALLAVVRPCPTDTLARAFLALAATPAPSACSGKPRTGNSRSRDTYP